jgi:hypothetical protein
MLALNIKRGFTHHAANDLRDGGVVGVRSGRLLRRRIVLASAIMAGFMGLLFAFMVLRTDVKFAPTSFFAGDDWVATETGYMAHEISNGNERICICGGYMCDLEQTDIERFVISYKGLLSRSFVIIKDPLAGDHPDRGREISAELTCVNKQKGELLELKLTEFKAPDSVGEKTVSYLQLEIE